MLALYPHLPELARDNRGFISRAVSWVAEQGIRQFVDIGSGLPTVENTHQVAQRHANALLTTEGRTAVLRGDLASPEAIFADPALTRLIRLEEPVAVIMAMVLHFFPPDDARGITAAIAAARRSRPGWRCPQAELGSPTPEVSAVAASIWRS